MFRENYQSIEEPSTLNQTDEIQRLRQRITELELRITDLELEKNMWERQYYK